MLKSPKKHEDTPCSHSKTIKTKGEKLHKFITVIQESNSNQSQENTKKKVHAGNSSKAIQSSRIWTSNKKTRKE